MNKRIRCVAAVLLLIVMTAVLAAGCASHAPAEETFIRIDRDDPEAWERELDNVRFLQEERMSGSAQFSTDQFRELADRLREQSENVWIVDCRLESHGMINGIAVSWCNGNNDANAGKTAKKVMAEEKRFSGLTGREVTAWTTEDDEPRDSVVLSVETWETEKALTVSEGFRYLRLACPDHCWPPAGVIDDFITFAAALEEDAWLHFHCQAGSGRTGAFMTIWEMMQRPDASVEEILQHQAETGSGNLLDRAKPEKTHAQKERCVLARAMYLYIRENRESGWKTKWSKWLREHSETVTMKVGEALERREAFSSDPLVVNDSTEAMTPGQATVLAGDTVYFITVE